MRQYQKIWLEIKKLPVGRELAIRTHCTAKARVIQAVKLEKTREVATKKKVGMMREGPLVIRPTTDTIKHDEEFVIIYFSLAWDATKL